MGPLAVFYIPKLIGLAAQNIMSQNSQMIRIFRTLRDVAESDSTVLLQGESGTGKELIALAIHDLSPRRQKPYITVNCGAIPDTLLVNHWNRGKTAHALGISRATLWRRMKRYVMIEGRSGQNGP